MSWRRRQFERPPVPRVPMHERPLPPDRRNVGGSHALDRYREHHPEAEGVDMLHALDAGLPLDKATARALLARAVERQGQHDLDEYVLAPDRRGMFVTVPNRDPRHRRPWIATYIRFLPSQRAFVLERWPPKPTAEERGTITTMHGGTP